jgi:hypothetical protein
VQGSGVPGERGALIKQESLTLREEVGEKRCGVEFSLGLVFFEHGRAGLRQGTFSQWDQGERG